MTEYYQCLKCKKLLARKTKSSDKEIHPKYKGKLSVSIPKNRYKDSEKLLKDIVCCKRRMLKLTEDQYKSELKRKNEK